MGENKRKGLLTRARKSTLLLTFTKPLLLNNFNAQPRILPQHFLSRSSQKAHLRNKTFFRLSICLEFRATNWRRIRKSNRWKNIQNSEENGKTKNFWSVIALSEKANTNYYLFSEKSFFNLTTILTVSLL